jgi:uncharacterized pyridoxal phosphate-containing UPF0001 family protein
MPAHPLTLPELLPHGIRRREIQTVVDALWSRCKVTAWSGLMAMASLVSEPSKSSTRQNKNRRRTKKRRKKNGSPSVH